MNKLDINITNQKAAKDTPAEISPLTKSFVPYQKAIPKNMCTHFNASENLPMDMKSRKKITPKPTPLIMCFWLPAF
jgi:hypothetical protein